MRPSALLLVPFEPPSARVADPTIRQTLGAHLDLPLREAFCDLEAHIGHRFDQGPTFGDTTLSRGPHRSLTAIALATALQRAGIPWRVLDPGACELDRWRELLRPSVAQAPPLVAVSSTFITSRPWFEALLALVRRMFPSSLLAVGGYYYTTDTEGFLSLDADVLAVGEGETRLVELVRRVQAGANLEGIAGLYLRGPDRALRYTGRAEPLDLSSLPAPDWTLASRIEPAVDVERLDYLGLETQRGCPFMCAFCTYRTLAQPSSLPATGAAERIAALAPQGYVELYDATATSPKARWQELCGSVAEQAPRGRGIGAFARVSDIDEAAAMLMQRAGVRHLYIGQESGDQRLLNAMRKGTRIDQVLPAIGALGRHRISVTFGLIHGFPGETLESLEATRRMLGQVNGSGAPHPTVFSYDVTPFSLQDFAAVSTDDALRDASHHFLGYRFGEFSVPRICREILRTVIHTSRLEHAPVAQLVFQRGVALPTSRVSTSDERASIFRWAKALERGVGIFLERQLDGTPPPRRELDAIAALLFEPYESQRSRLRGVASRLEGAALSRLRQEWTREQGRGVGPLTRVVLAEAERRAGSDARRVVGRLLRGPEVKAPAPTASAAQQATALLDTTDRRYLARAPASARE